MKKRAPASAGALFHWLFDDAERVFEGDGFGGEAFAVVASLVAGGDFEGERGGFDVAQDFDGDGEFGFAEVGFDLHVEAFVEGGDADGRFDASGDFEPLGAGEGDGGGNGAAFLLVHGIEVPAFGDAGEEGDAEDLAGFGFRGGGGEGPLDGVGAFGGIIGRSEAGGEQEGGGEEGVGGHREVLSAEAGSTKAAWRTSRVSVFWM